MTRSSPPAPPRTTPASARAGNAPPSPPGGRLWRVPDLPEHYLPRPEAIAALTDALLGQAPGTIGITATGSAAGKHGLHGMGGIGKSVLAAVLCRQPTIQQRYPDGIYWLPVGQTPQLLSLQAELARALGHAEPFDNVTDGRQRLRELLADRAALLVLDDVWDAAHADKLAVPGARGCVLVTTRDRTVLQSGAEHCLDVLSHAQALALLGHWVDQDGPSLPAAAAQVAEACGRLPLALATIGAMVRADEIDWTDARELLAHADLTELAARFPDYPYPSILAAIEVSVNAMDERARARYLDLAIFPEDTPIPEAALAVLWQAHGLAGARLRRLLGTLAARSLATRDDDGRVRLHDLQRMYIQQRADDLPARHAQLIDAYAARCPDGFGRGEDDGYLFQHLPWHLAQAGHHDQLASLLSDFDWLDAKLRAAGITELLADFALLPSDHETSRDARLIRDALRLSSHVLAHDPDQLPSQILGRIGHFGRSPAEPIPRLLAQTRSANRRAWLEPLVPSLTPPGGPLLATLSGHEDAVTAVAVTPDSRRVLSASKDETLKLWDLHTGTELYTLAGHSHSIAAVAVTPDGQHALSASWDRTFKLWDLNTGTELRTLAGHSSWIRAIAITPDGKHAISASEDKTLKIWDLDSGAELRTLTGHSDGVTAVTVAPDGIHALSASRDKTLKLWDLHSGAELCTLAGHSRSIAAVAVTPDGKRALSASWDHSLMLWDLAGNAEPCALTGHSGWVRAVAVTPDGKRALSASDDKTLKLWDLDAGTELCTLTGHSRGIAAVAITPDGKRALSASRDKTLKLWDLDVGAVPSIPTGHSDRVLAVAVTPDGKRALSASRDKTLKLWDLDTCAEICTLAGHSEGIRAIAVTPDGRRAISGSEDKTLKLWDLDTCAEPCTLAVHSGQVTAVAVTPDGTHAISTSGDKAIRLWDLDTHTEVCTLAGHSGWIRAVVVTPDGKLAISASDDATLRLWDLDDRAELCMLAGHDRGVTAVAVTPGGTHALSASWDHTLKLWDLHTGTEQLTLTGHTERVRAVTVTLDGKRAISASWDHTLKLWDLHTGQCLATFTGEGAMEACAASAVNDLVIAGDGAGRIYILRLVEPIGGTAITKPSSAHTSGPNPPYPVRPLDRAGAPAHLRAQPNEPVPVLGQRERDRIVELIEACHGLHDPQTRGMLVGRLPHDIRVRIPHAPAMRMHLANIVDTCASFPDGLAALAVAVRWIAGENATAVHDLYAFLALLGGQADT